jgi:hypothetical protein
VQLAGETGNPTRWDHDTAAQIAQSVPEAFAWTGSKWDEAILTSYRLVIVGWVRDIFPFRPVTLDSAWLTSTVLALAQQMYDSHDFSAMPILADAFMDSGCDNDEILNHCRDPKQVHVRGCWVVDAILGKE